jgi:hypothetical protein
VCQGTQISPDGITSLVTPQDMPDELMSMEKTEGLHMLSQQKASLSVEGGDQSVTTQTTATKVGPVNVSRLKTTGKDSGIGSDKIILDFNSLQEGCGLMDQT